MLNIIVFGAGGKMGRTMTALAASKGAHIIAGVSRTPFAADFPVFSCATELSCAAESAGLCADVAVDFSHPEALDATLDYCLVSKLPAVIGTTGLTESAQLRLQAAAMSIPIFYSANMSVGVYAFSRLAAQAAAILQGYDIEIVERHHRQKADAPSGTAVALLAALQGARLSNTSNGDCTCEVDSTIGVGTSGLQLCKQRAVFGRQGACKRKEGEIGMHSIRGGSIAGDHCVIFAGQGEVIELSHHAQNREIFAAGALEAARFIATQPAGLYGMDDLLQ